MSRSTYQITIGSGTDKGSIRAEVTQFDNGTNRLVFLTEIKELDKMDIGNIKMKDGKLFIPVYPRSKHKELVATLASFIEKIFMDKLAEEEVKQIGDYNSRKSSDSDKGRDPIEVDVRADSGGEGIDLERLHDSGGGDIDTPVNRGRRNKADVAKKGNPKHT